MYLLPDSWLDDDRSFKITTPPVHTFDDMLVKDFFVPGTREWDMEVVNKVFSGSRSNSDPLYITSP